MTNTRLIIMAFAVLIILVYLHRCFFTPSLFGSSYAATILEPERDMGMTKVGVQIVHFSLHNNSSSEIRIVGALPTCGVRSCITPLLDFNTTIPPFSAINLVYQIDIRSPGKFSCASRLFLEDKGLRVIKLSVYGVGIVAEGKFDAETRP